MDIRHLNYFVEVAKHLNFTKAADGLHISQPSLSKTIKNIEDKLNVTLFIRASRQLQLTDAGKALLHNAKEVLHAYQNLTSELDDVVNIKKGEIKIGIPPIIGAAYCSNMINNFIEKYPTIDITLREVGTKTITDEVADGSLDVGFVCTMPQKRGSFKVKQILQDPLKLIVHKTHPIAKLRQVDFHHIINEPLIMYRHDFSLYDSIMTEFSKLNLKPNIVCKSSQKDFMIEMVGAKLGVALLPGKICNQITNNDIITLAFNEPLVLLELGVIWGKNRYLSYTVKQFLNEL